MWIHWLPPSLVLSHSQEEERTAVFPANGKSHGNPLVPWIIENWLPRHQMFSSFKCLITFHLNQGPSQETIRPCPFGLASTGQESLLLGLLELHPPDYRPQKATMNSCAQWTLKDISPHPMLGIFWEAMRLHLHLPAVWNPMKAGTERVGGAVEMLMV